MPSQKSGGQVLTALQHRILESHQNFSGTWEVCAKIKKHFQLLILTQLSEECKLAWGETRGMVWTYHPVVRYRGLVQIKTDEAKESTNKESKTRTMMEQEPKIMRKSRHSYSLEVSGAVQSHWRNSLTYLSGGSKHQSDPNLLGRLIADSYRLTHNPYNLLSTWQCTRLLCFGRLFSREDAYFNLQAPRHSYCFMLSLKKSFS